MKKAFPYILIFIIAILILLLIKKPDIERFEKQQFWDSISLANRDKKIDVLSNDNKKLTTYTDSLQSLIRSLDSTHSKEISTIKYKTKKELENIRAEYIKPGTDSSELIQEVTKYKELDFCQDQRMLQGKVINMQILKIDNLNTIINKYKEKEVIYKRMIADRDKRLVGVEKAYKNKLLKTKIVSGVIIAGTLVLIILVGS